MNILDALKGIGDRYEIQRVLGALGTVTYVVMAPAFIWAGKINASLEGFCLTYPAGLAACIGATAGAIALKDRQTATSKVIQDTGAQPKSAAPDAPMDVVVTNAENNPVPTKDQKK